MIFQKEINKIDEEIKQLERMRDGDLQLDCGLPIKKEIANKLFRHSLAERSLWECQAVKNKLIQCSKAVEEVIDKLIGFDENGEIGYNKKYIDREELKEQLKEVELKLEEKNEINTRNK